MNRIIPSVAALLLSINPVVLASNLDQEIEIMDIENGDDIDFSKLTDYVETYSIGQGRSPVGDSTQYPNRVVGLLLGNFDGAIQACTASLVNKQIIVTAAHCLINPRTQQFVGGWFYPAKNSEKGEPYGRVNVSRVIYMTGYINKLRQRDFTGAYNFDVALGVLSKPLQIGYLGMGYGGNHLSNGKYLRTIGYHADKRKASMWEGYCRIQRKVSFGVVEHDCLSAPHASGSPLINDQNMVYAVSSGSYYPQNKTWATAIPKTLFDYVKNFK